MSEWSDDDVVYNSKVTIADAGKDQFLCNENNTVFKKESKLLFDIEKDFSDDVILAKVREKLETQPGTYTSIFGADRVETIRNFIAA